MKRIATLMLAFFLLAGISYGETKGVERWVKTFAHKLGIAAGKVKKKTATSVAGIKGVEEEAGEELYWKKTDVSAEEVEALRAALRYVEEGKEAEAAEALRRFIEEYPKSPFVKDARDGLAILAGGEV
ncbi:MAG: hypothetical protein ACE5GF_07285 [Thermodesulfobacteriota bacterium]